MPDNPKPTDATSRAADALDQWMCDQGSRCLFRFSAVDRQKIARLMLAAAQVADPQPTEETIERVARAICDEGDGDNGEWPTWVPEAHRAITAIMEGALRRSVTIKPDAPQLPAWCFQPDVDMPGLYLQCENYEQRDAIMRALGAPEAAINVREE